MEQLTQNITTPTRDERSYLTQNKLEKYLGVTTMTIHLWRKMENHPLPFRVVRTVGGKPRILYPTVEVLSWVKQYRPRLYEKLGGGDAQHFGSERVVYRDSERVAS